ncbi:MAG: CBS domain-containing protein [Fuerstiella sp.]|nr:CBS domain-containing protein [Fuerstiella sp.]MCP4855960.1 CBS domain-containing protein [Fuerstiella sp.]
MSSDGIEEEERIANERLNDPDAEFIHGSIRELSGLHDTIVALDRSATVGDAVQTMIQNRLGVILIVEDNKLIGLFSERDVLTRVVAQERVPAVTPIVDVMTPDPECLHFDDEIVFALNKMTVGGFRHVPILDDDGAPIAVVSMRDVVDHIVSYYSNEVFNIPATPDARVSSRREGA